MFRDNFYAGTPTADPMPSLILMTRLCYTKTHIDGGGGGAWMYLLSGGNYSSFVFH